MKLIDKDAVVAEIAKRVKESEIVLRDCPSSAILGLAQAYKNVLSFIGTLEVKEVDLEKDVKQYLKDNFTSVEKPDEFLTTLMQLDDMVSFAKHFFELGLKAQKGGKA